MENTIKKNNPYSKLENIIESIRSDILNELGVDGGYFFKLLKSNTFIFHFFDEDFFFFSYLGKPSILIRKKRGSCYNDFFDVSNCSCNFYCFPLFRNDKYSDEIFLLNQLNSYYINDGSYGKDNSICHHVYDASSLTKMPSEILFYFLEGLKKLHSNITDYKKSIFDFLDEKYSLNQKLVTEKIFLEKCFSLLCDDSLSKIDKEKEPLKIL